MKWEYYSLEELLLHLALVLDWRDGYPEGHFEGTSIAVHDNYEIIFNSEFESLSVYVVNGDGSKERLWYGEVELFQVWDSIIDARIRGIDFVCNFKPDELWEVITKRLAQRVEANETTTM